MGQKPENGQKSSEIVV